MGEKRTKHFLATSLRTRDDHRASLRAGAGTAIAEVAAGTRANGRTRRTGTTLTVHLAISSGSKSFPIDNRTPNTHERQHLTTLRVSTLSDPDVERFRISCFAQKQVTCYAKVINL